MFAKRKLFLYVHFAERIQSVANCVCKEKLRLFVDWDGNTAKCKQCKQDANSFRGDVFAFICRQSIKKCQMQTVQTVFLSHLKSFYLYQVINDFLNIFLVLSIMLYI